MSKFEIITDDDSWGDVRSEIQQGATIKFVAVKKDHNRKLILAEGIQTHSSLLNSLRYRICKNINDKSIILIGAGHILPVGYIIPVKGENFPLKAYWDSTSCQSQEGYDRPTNIDEANEIAEEIANTVRDWFNKVLS